MLSNMAKLVAQFIYYPQRRPVGNIYLQNKCLFYNYKNKLFFPLPDKRE